MKKPPLFFLLFGFLALGALQGGTASRALADDETPAKQSDAGKDDADKKGDADKKDEKKKKKETDITGGRFTGDPIYVHIAPMILPIINDDGVEQLVTLILSVHVKDLDSANALHTNMPRAVDSLLRHLYGGLDEGSLRNGKLVNVNKVKKNAILAIGEIIGDENVVDVLVEGVAQRML
jgi:hypothetical protein